VLISSEMHPAFIRKISGFGVGLLLAEDVFITVDEEVRVFFYAQRLRLGN
jgi:hypothetical protein